MPDSPAAQGDSATVRVPPPLIFAGSLLAGWLLQAWAYTLDFGLSTQLTYGLAALFTAAGVLLGAWAIGLFFKTGQNPEPWKPTPQLIPGGIYRFSRNPMYVGMALLQLAIALALNNPWMALLTPLSVYAVYRLAVLPEEAYLEYKFGESYRAYKASVRRWL